MAPGSKTVNDPAKRRMREIVVEQQATNFRHRRMTIDLSIGCDAANSLREQGQWRGQRDSPQPSRRAKYKKCRPLFPPSQELVSRERSKDNKPCLSANCLSRAHDPDSRKPARLSPSRKCSWSRGALIRI